MGREGKEREGVNISIRPYINDFFVSIIINFLPCDKSHEVIV